MSAWSQLISFSMALLIYLSLLLSSSPQTNEIVGKKTAGAVRAGMSVMACIGEQLAERESGATMEVCAAQVKKNEQTRLPASP